MPRTGLDPPTGGLALLLGYALLVVVLFRDPKTGLSIATASIQGVLFFVAAPLAGVLSGGYVYQTRSAYPYVAFLTGSYLAVVGLALVLLPVANATVVTVTGIVLFALAVLALLASLRPTVSAILPSSSLSDVED